jgi:tryptophan synthase alpha subunit
MPKGKSDREIVTHDELIKLFREYKQAKCSSPSLANACKCRLESKFKTAIAEAQTMGVLAVDLLIDLRELTDPESEEKEIVCPPTLRAYLNHSIAYSTAVEKKKEIRGSQRAAEVEA